MRTVTNFKLTWFPIITLIWVMISQTGCERKNDPTMNDTTMNEPTTVAEIAVSSNMFPGDARYNPNYLMENRKAIWHAQSPVKFPEWIKVTFKSPANITHLGIMAQDDSPAGNEHTRGPKDFILQASNDGTNWRELLKVSRNVYTKGGEWKEWDFQNKEKYYYYRIYITAGNDPGLLTIRQIKLR